MSFLNNFNKWRNFRKNNFISKLSIKKLHFGLSNSGGRGNSGRIHSFYRGGGHKRSYKFLDIKRDFIFFWNIPALVISVVYDAVRSANLALILYANGFFSYILSSENLRQGSTLSLGTLQNYFEGDRMPLFLMQFGTKIHNVSYWSRSAGCFSKYLGPVKNNCCIISLPSGTRKLLKKDALATLGMVGNVSHYKIKKYKAGQNRWLSIRPHVRGVAKNPIDHPMGGGQGKTSGGRVSVTPWGKYTKGFKTKRKLHEKKRKKMLTF